MSELSIARVVIAAFFTLALAGAISDARAQEKSPASKAEAPRRRVGCPFFRNAPLDFWGDRKAKPDASEKELPAPNGARETIWAEPIRQPNGQISVYVPPKAVMEFLKNPSRETGKAYLAWQSERMRQLKASVEILRELRQEAGIGPDEAPVALPGLPADPSFGPLATPEPVPSPAARAEILYFKRTGCPYCAKQDQVFAALKTSHPNVSVRTLMPGDEPELWKAYDVKVVPSMVVLGANQRRLMLRGFIEGEKLARVLEEVNRAKP